MHLLSSLPLAQQLMRAHSAHSTPAAAAFDSTDVHAHVPFFFFLSHICLTGSCWLHAQFNAAPPAQNNAQNNSTRSCCLLHHVARLATAGSCIHTSNFACTPCCSSIAMAHHLLCSSAMLQELEQPPCSRLTMLLVIISTGTLVAASVTRARPHATLPQHLRLPRRHLSDSNVHVLPQAL